MSSNITRVFNLSPLVSQICEPFFMQVGFKHLYFSRLYHSGEIAFLTNLPDAVQCFFDLQTPFPTIKKSGDFLPEGLYLMPDLPIVLGQKFLARNTTVLANSIITHRNHFQIDNGLVIVYQYQDFDEVFYLGAMLSNDGIYEFTHRCHRYSAWHL